MEKIIEIPEGYEARIEGNKVVLEPKESEDERIRKYLIDVVNDYCKGSEYEGCIAYLEKLKEQQVLPLMGEDTNLYFDEWKQRFKGNPTKRQCFEEGIRYSERKQKEPEWCHHKVDLSGCSEEYRKAYYDGWNNCNQQHSQLQAEQKPAEWSEEDEKKLSTVISLMKSSRAVDPFYDKMCLKDWLNSLPKRFDLQPKQESEPIEIKFAGKIYKVYGTKELPGGIVGYIIEDEPGHYDCIIHPDEVLGGGYGIKSNGSPYPTKEANFGQPHWKPSEEQMEALQHAIDACECEWAYQDDELRSLLNELKKLM